MATEFEQLLKEQQKTNALLTEQGKPTTLGQSFRSSLAEILSDRRLAKQDYAFQKKEGVTQVDEGVSRVEEIEGKQGEVLEKQSEFFLKEIGFLKHQDTLLSEQRGDLIELIKRTEITNEALKYMILLGGQSNTTQEEAANVVKTLGIIEQKIADNQPTPSQIKSGKKKEESLDKRIIKSLTGLKNTFTGFRKDFTGIMKMLPGGSFLRKAGLLGLLFGGLAFLSSPLFIKTLEIFDKNIIPAIKKLYEDVLKPLGKNILDRVTKLADDILNPDKSVTQVIKDNMGTIFGAVAILYSRTIVGFGIALLARTLTIKNIAGFSAAVAGLFSRLINGKKGKVSPLGKLLRGSGIITIILGLFGAAMNSVGEEAERRRKELELTRFDQGTGGFIGGIFGGVNDMIGMIISIFDKDLGEKYQREMGTEATTRSVENISKKVRTFLGDLFDNILGKLRRLFFGATQEDLEGDIEDTKKQIGELNKQISKMQEQGKPDDIIADSIKQRDDLLKTLKVREDKLIEIFPAADPKVKAQFEGAFNDVPMEGEGINRAALDKMTYSVGGAGLSSNIVMDNSIKNTSSSTIVGTENISNLDTITQGIIKAD